MHGRADTAPILASTRARPVSPCAAHSAPVSIPVDNKQLRGPMDAQQPTDSEVFEFEERCWIMYERLSRAAHDGAAARECARLSVYSLRQ